MSYSAANGEEETLETYFDRNKFSSTAGGDTSQLRPACSFVQRFITQELCGDLATASTVAELWMYFPAILTRIFGRQDSPGAVQATGSGPGTGGYGGGVSEENSWMFAATSFYALGDKLYNHPPRLNDKAKASLPTRTASSSSTRGRSSNSSNSNNSRMVLDGRVCCMTPLATSLLSLLLARPLADQPSSSNTAKSLFAILLEPREVWYTFSCMSPPMPPHTMAFLRHEARPDSILFENARLYTHCLTNPPSIFPLGGMPRQAVGFPHNPRGVAALGAEAMDVARVAPELKLSPLEFYLFSFAWYALSSGCDFYAGLAGPGRMPPHQHQHYSNAGGWGGVNFRPERVALAWRRYGVKGLIHRNPYMTMLKDYVEAFFPREMGTSSAGGAGSGSNAMNPQCELFLRVLVELWLEGNTVLRPGVCKEGEQNSLQAWPTATNSGIPGSVVVPTSTMLPALPRVTAIYDPSAALLASEYTCPTDVSLHGLLVLSAHLLADPRLPEALSGRLRASGGGGDYGVGLPSAGGVAVPALTPALALLRPHVFGFLRVALSAESTMHTSSAVFGLAVELWLLWMRPWAAIVAAKGNSPCPPKPAPNAETSGNSRPAGNSDGSARRAGRQSWVQGIVASAREFMHIESAPNGDTSSRGNDNSDAGSGGGSGRASVGTGARGASTARTGGRYSFDPWGAWVLENYSLYTTILAAFSRKAVNMSFKVQGPTDSRSGGGGVGIGAFAEAGRSNVDLLWRVAEVFSPDLTSLLMSAQNTVKQHSGLSAGGAGLRASEEDILEEGRKAVASIQGPRLVTLDVYQGSAEDLLGAMAELTSPRPAAGWTEKMSQKLGLGPVPDTAEGLARGVASKFKELFGLPSTWQPKGHADGISAGKVKLGDLFEPEREKHAPAFLSSQGRTQLASGRRVCKPWNVEYVGDPMYHPRRKWEANWTIEFWADDEDSDDDGTFEDEGPSKAIELAKEFQQRRWREGPWARIPRRVNLRLLADVRACLGLMVAFYLLLVMVRLNATAGITFATALVALSVRLSVME